MPRKRAQPAKPLRLSGSYRRDCSEPDWAPLFALVGRDLIGWFMWMGAYDLADGSILHCYKHRWTRRSIHLTEDGRCFYFDWSGEIDAVIPDDAYVAIDRWRMLRAVFENHRLCDKDEHEELEAQIELATRIAFVHARFDVDATESGRTGDQIGARAPAA